MTYFWIGHWFDKPGSCTLGSGGRLWSAVVTRENKLAWHTIHGLQLRSWLNQELQVRLNWPGQMRCKLSTACSLTGLATGRASDCSTVLMVTPAARWTSPSKRSGHHPVSSMAVLCYTFCVT
jgi:hypothetical protein